MRVKVVAVTKVMTITMAAGLTFFCPKAWALQCFPTLGFSVGKDDARKMLKNIQQWRWGVNQSDCHGVTPLHLFVNAGLRQEVSQLAAMGAFLQIGDACGHTPLQHAVGNQDPEMVAHLLDLGARHDMLSAALLGDLELMKVLYLQGEEPSEAWPSGMTPLLAAARRGDLEMVRWLWEVTREGRIFPSDMSPPGPCGFGGAYAAFNGTFGTLLETVLDPSGPGDKSAENLQGRMDVAHFLLTHGLPMEQTNLPRDYYRINLLAAPVAACRWDVVQLLLDRGVEEHWPTSVLFRLAAKQCMPAFLAHLVKEGADPQQRGGDGKTPLDEARENNNHAAVEWFKEKGWRASSGDAQGQALRLLMQAIKRNDVAAARAAVSAGAPVNAGGMPLRSAVEGGNVKLVKLLLSVGADANIPRRDRSENLVYPLNDLPYEGDRLGLARALVEGGADVALADGEEPLLTNHLPVDPRLALYLLDQGANPGADNDLGYTPLIMAVGMYVQTPQERALQLEVVKALLQRDVDLQAKNFDGTTALHAALYEGEDGQALVDLLLAAGAKLDLFACIRLRDYPCMETLLKNGDVPHRDGDGRPYLFTAVADGGPRAVRLLLEAGMPPNDRDPNGAGLLTAYGEFPPQEEAKEVVTLLLEHGWDPAQGAQREELALVEAIRFNRNLALVLLDAGVSPNVRDYRGWSALHAAAGQGDAVMVQRLLEKGADLTVQDFQAWTPLDHARRTYNGCPISRYATMAEISGHKKVIRLLSEKSGRVPGAEQMDQHLVLAVEEGDLPEVKKLLKQGADPNALSAQGKGGDCLAVPVLVIALREGRLEVAKALLAMGAFPNPRVQEFQQLWPFLWKNGFIEEALVLLNYGSRQGLFPLTSTSLEEPARFHAVAIMSALAQQGAQVNPLPQGWGLMGNGGAKFVSAYVGPGAPAPDRERLGFFPLGWAARNGYAELVSLLVKKGAKMDQRDNQGNTALHLACRHQRYDIAERLLAAGADHTLKNDDNKTALEMPRKGSCWGSAFGKGTQHRTPVLLVGVLTAVLIGVFLGVRAWRGVRFNA